MRASLFVPTFCGGRKVPGGCEHRCDMPGAQVSFASSTCASFYSPVAPAGWHRLPRGQDTVRWVPARPESVHLAGQPLLSRRQVQQTWARGVPAAGDQIRGPSPAWSRPRPAREPSGSSGTLEVKPGTSSWKEGRPGAMRGSSRRCPQRPGLPLRGVTARPGGVCR